MPEKLEPKKSCATCVWSRFEKTATGRLRKTHYGTCHYIVHWPPLPSSMRQPAEHDKVAIWPKDGTDCPVHDPIKVS